MKYVPLRGCLHLKCFYLRWPMLISKRAFCCAIRKRKDLEGVDVDEYSLKQEILEEISSMRVATKLSVYDAPNIVRHLPKLKSVDLSNTDCMYDTLLVILKGCKELESSDITGGGDLGIDPERQKFAAGMKKFQFDKGPSAEKAAWFCQACADEDYTSTVLLGSVHVHTVTTRKGQV